MIDLGRLLELARKARSDAPLPQGEWTKAHAEFHSEASPAVIIGLIERVKDVERRNKRAGATNVELRNRLRAAEEVVTEARRTDRAIADHGDVWAVSDGLQKALRRYDKEKA